MIDLSLYLVTDPDLCCDLGVPQTVRQAVAAGVRVVQLRDSAATDAEFTDLGRALARELAGNGVPLILNDRAHLVDAVGAQGVHVGQGDLDITAARALIGPDRILGLSAETPTQIARAEQTGHQTLDYLGAGAFRATATKPDHPPAQGIAMVRQVAARSPWPVVVIGGVGVADVAQIRRAGAAGVAVVSAICGQPDVGAATTALRHAWDGAAEQDGAA